MRKIWRRIFKSKEMREYSKMYKRHRKTMIRLAKEDYDWDWCYLHQLVMTKIKHMHEYYSAGNNIWQSDETLLKIIEQLQKIIDLDTEIEKMKDEPLDVKIVHIDGGIKCIYPDNYREQIKQYEEKEQNLYKELYSSIGENLRWWWD